MKYLRIKNNHIILIIYFSLFTFHFSLSQAQDTLSASFIFAGDIMGHGPQINAAYDSSSDTYNFDPVFCDIKPVIDSVDVAIANLEVTLGGKPFTGYPAFSSPDELAVAAKNAGFDILLTANNHCVDRNQLGLERTINILDSLNISHTGTFKNIKEKELNYPFFFTKKGIRFALLNYTYGTNGLPVTVPNIVNLIDRKQILIDIKKADSLKADVIIATLHWGIEYQRTQNDEQKNLADFLLKNGCHAVIGSHPHVIQPIELVYLNKSDSTIVKPVVYSLGNFVSNQRDRYRDGGILFKCTFNKNREKVSTTNICYKPYWIYKGWENGKMQYRIIPICNNKYDIKLSVDDESKINTFYQDTRELLVNIKECGCLDF